MYSLTYSQTALKQLKEIDDKTRGRIINSIERCRIRPYPHVEKLVGLPYFRLRVGHYRVIMSIEEDKLAILIIKIGHRKNIYKSL